MDRFASIGDKAGSPGTGAAVLRWAKSEAMRGSSIVFHIVDSLLGARRQLREELGRRQVRHFLAPRALACSSPDHLSNHCRTQSCFVSARHYSQLHRFGFQVRWAVYKLAAESKPIVLQGGAFS